MIDRAAWAGVIQELFGKPELLADDFPYGPVVVAHLDGCSFILYHAILREKGVKVYVFTEHNGYFEWEKEDLAGFFACAAQ